MKKKAAAPKASTDEWVAWLRKEVARIHKKLGMKQINPEPK
jgi:hypothetical protein